jgi:membrane protease YdiL (CAAX protease family)
VSCQEKNNELEFSIPVIIILSLAPGLIILFWAFLFSNPIFGINFSIYLSLMLAILLGLIPTELAIMKYFAWKNKAKIRDIILFREKTSLKRLLPSILIPFILAAIFFLVIPKFEKQLYGNFFTFVPDWFRIDRFNTNEGKFLILTLVLNFLLNGIFGPLVEELYFRGFLLPRMGIFGKIAPLINTILFSVYHFFTPWENITRILAVAPLSYSVWINKNVRIGIIIHCSLNTFGCIGLLLSILV